MDDRSEVFNGNENAVEFFEAIQFKPTRDHAPALTVPIEEKAPMQISKVMRLEDSLQLSAVSSQHDHLRKWMKRDRLYGLLLLEYEFQPWHRDNNVQVEFGWGIQRRRHNIQYSQRDLVL